MGRRTLLTLVLGLSFSFAAGADPDLVPGQTVHMNEGWFRIEEPGTPEEGFVGTLEVGLQGGEEEAREEAPSPTPRPPLEAPTVQPVLRRTCREEENRYLRELFRIAGIWYFPDALDLVEALDRVPGVALSPWLRFSLFGWASPGTQWTGPAGVDPIRPLAWDEGLRWAAEDLVRCASSASP